MPLNLNRLSFRNAFPNDRALLVHLRTRFTRAAERRPRQDRDQLLTLGDGYRVPLPVFMILDRRLFTRPGHGSFAELISDPVIGAYTPVFTDEGLCTRTVRARRPANKRAAAVASPEQLWAVLALLLRAGVPRVAFLPDGRSYPLRDLVDLIPLPG
jgi:hypothetical protein